MEGRILVVDDEAIVLESCRRILEGEGYPVVVASGAREALERLESEPVRLLVVDLLMPEQDGLVLIAQVKKRYPAVPIVLISGLSTGEVERDGLRLGAAAFVPKPFTPEELIGAVTRVLEEGR